MTVAELPLLWGLCVVAALVVVVLKVNKVARSSELIYKARHRDHAKVPRMEWRK